MSWFHRKASTQAQEILAETQARAEESAALRDHLVAVGAETRRHLDENGFPQMISGAIFPKKTH
jgi:hypothetical protein